MYKGFEGGEGGGEGGMIRVWFRVYWKGVGVRVSANVETLFKEGTEAEGGGFEMGI